MTSRFLPACGLVLALAVPGLAQGGEVRLVIKDGRVTLSARDATLREILLEWERVGGTRVVNRDRVSGAPLTIELTNVPEAQALATLLRPIAGYMAARRVGPEGGASDFSRIILMPGEAAPLTAGNPNPAQASAPSGMGGGPPSGTMGGGPPSGRPGLQRRVMPDGRVVTIMDDAQRMNEPDDNEEVQQPPANAPGLMRPPFQAPVRMQQGQPVDDPSQPDRPYPQTMPPTTVAPTLPPTSAVPGIVPAAKQPGATPAAPPKPPGR